MSELIQEVASEKSRTAELQKASKQNQEIFTKLQSDFYGKESEVSALRQDLKVNKVQAKSSKNNLNSRQGGL